jgi:hypothetical protein
MKVTKTIGLLGVLILAMTAVHSASAALPYSTYGAENGWAGYKDYTKDNFDIRVSFNVYDQLSPFPWSGDPIPAEDKFIYAYEIMNMGDESNNEIAAFTLLYADGSAIPQHLMHLTHSEDNGSGGIKPDPDATPYQGEWVWSGEYGYIETGQHSWLLVFCSDHAPVKGTFEVQKGADVPIVPEPATIIFFGSAAGWILTRRNNTRRSS